MLKTRNTNSGFESEWEGYLTIPFISQWKEKTNSFPWKAGSQIILDLKNIQRIDASGVQLLVYLKKKSEDKHCLMTIRNHSLPVLKCFDLLGVVSFFGDKIKLKKEYANEVEFSYGTKKA